MAIQWKNGANWEAIPAAAMSGTYGGTCHVEYPQAADFDGNGLPCGAVGRARIVIRSPWMTDSGFGFWRGKFSAATDEYVAMSISVFNPRSGTDDKFAGYLHRPTFGSLGRSTAAGTTVYRDVQIIISELVTTT